VAARFLAEEADGYETNWFPLLSNGAGDYLLYETAAGEQHGKLLAYWHDDDARIVVEPSLETWAEHVAAALKKLPSREPSPPEPRRTALPPGVKRDPLSGLMSLSALATCSRVS
jgi:hypothetical protein